MHTPMARAVILDTLGEKDLQRLLDDHQKLLILYGFANAISTAVDSELLLNEAMNVVFGLVDAERGAIFLLDSKTGQWVRGASRTRQSHGKNEGIDIVLKNETIDEILREKKAILALDTLTDPRFKEPQAVASYNTRSCLCVPLASQQRVLGILYVDSPEPGHFSKEQLTLVSGIANQTAIALENIESVQRLKEERKRIGDILKALPVAILSMDEEGMISFVNPRAEKLFGVSYKECLGRSCQSFLGDDYFRPLLNLVMSALREKRGTTLQEVACGNSDKPLLLQVDIVSLKEGVAWKGILVALEDVTEKKSLEREVSNAEKLSAIGEMAAGLVHEIINPLSIISGRAQLLLFDKKEETEVTKTARIIREQVDRASAITQKLLSFARQRPPQLCPLSLHEVLEKFLETMEEQFASQKIRVAKNFSDVPLPFLGDEEQLEEVFVNLSRNAIHAMPGGGKFTITTRRKAECAEVSLTDTGCGIPPENLSKIFVPFFTTKSRGTGLGLSIVHGIVKNHGGTLSVQSHVGKGTTFILSFPLMST